MFPELKRLFVRTGCSSVRNHMFFVGLVTYNYGIAPIVHCGPSHFAGFCGHPGESSSESHFLDVVLNLAAILCW